MIFTEIPKHVCFSLSVDIYSITLYNLVGTNSVPRHTWFIRHSVNKGIAISILQLSNDKNRPFIADVFKGHSFACLTFIIHNHVSIGPDHDVGLDKSFYFYIFINSFSAELFKVDLSMFKIGRLYFRVIGVSKYFDN